MIAFGGMEGVTFQGCGCLRVSGFRVQVSGFRVQGSGFRVQGLGFNLKRAPSVPAAQKLGGGRCGSGSAGPCHIRV